MHVAFNHIFRILSLCSIAICVFLGIWRYSQEKVVNLGPIAKIKCPILQEGDTVYIVAPGSWSGMHNVKKAAELFKNMGLVPKYSPDIVTLDGNPEMEANTVEFRTRDLAEAMRDPNVKAIFAMRGGRGTDALLNYKDDNSLVRMNSKSLSPKWLVGFCDITVLDGWINDKFNWTSLRGRVLELLLNDPKMDSVMIEREDELDRWRDWEEIDEWEERNQEKQLLWDILFGRIDHLEYELIPLNNKAVHSYKIESEITGGNLSLIQTTAGTPWQINTNSKILLLEEHGEIPGRAMRVLRQLENAQIIQNKMSAIIFADFTPIDSEMTDALANFARAHENIPIYRMHNVGHLKINNPIPLGYSSTIESGRITIHLKTIHTEIK